MLSVVYITSRIEPKVNWFLDSLDYQTSVEDKSSLEIIFVDRLMDGEYAQQRQDQFREAVNGRYAYKHVAPKSNAWQGSKRLTSVDWFAASNARNTGLICSSGDYIVFVDDLSVLTGEWFKAVRESMTSGKVTCGAYRKVKELQVDNGNITYFANHPTGIDNRFQYGNDYAPVPCGGNWLYGCSFACPVQFLLDVNGSDEACDGMGFEDCILGIRLANRGIHFQYDRRMMSYESEELHHLDKVMRRTDKGISPNDKSHAILALANGTNRADNAHFGTDGTSGLRKAYQETGTIPEIQLPTHDWYDGKAIADMI